MDFSFLPDTICLRIFLELLFDQQVRIARVSKRFRQISNLAISKNQSLNLAESSFQKITLECLSNLIQLCRRNLKRLYIHSRGPFQQERLFMFSTFIGPRLEKIDIGYLHIENDSL